LPDGDAALKFAAAISAAGNARTTTVRGWTAEEFSKLAAEAPSAQLQGSAQFTKRRRSAANLLTKEARRIAVNFAKRRS
jgi:hypothetical protein